MSDLDPYDLSRSRDMSRVESTELAALREQNERLWECVKAADAMREKMRKVYQRPAFMGVFDVYRVHGFTYPNDDADNWIREQDGYDAARAALGEVDREG